MSLGLRIRTLRKAKKMTQQHLADATEVSRIYIQALESNRRTPSMKLLRRIAKELDVEAAHLLADYPRAATGRLQLDELFVGPEPLEIWYRSHRLTERDISMVHRLIEAALADWSIESREPREPKSESAESEKA